MMVNQTSEPLLLKRILMLRRHWVWLLQASLACAAGAFALSMFLPKTYRATTYVLISDSKIGESSRDSNLQQMAMLPTFVPFVENEALISESLSKFNLDRPPFNLTAEGFRRRHLDVRIPRSARLLEVNIEFPDARLAAGLANDIAQGAVRFNDKLNATDTTSSREFLKRRFDEVSATLNQVAARKLKVQEEARIEVRERELAVLQREKETLHATLQQLRLELVQNNVRSGALDKALADEPEKILLQKNVTSDRYLELVAGRLNAEGVPLSVTEESINTIRENLRRDYINVTVSAAAQQTAVDTAVARLAAVDRQISELVQALLSWRSQLAAVEGEYALALEAVRSASREYEAASVTVTAKSQDLKQVSPALVPQRPVGPKTFLNTVVGFFFGALLFSVVTLFRQSYRAVEDVQPEKAPKVVTVRG